MTVIEVPTINDTLWDFRTLRRIWHQATTATEVRLEFSKCRFLKQNAVAFLGGLIRLLRQRGIKTVVGVSTLVPTVRKNLDKNGFIKAFTGQAYPWKDNTIPYREDWNSNPRGFQNYLSTEWLGQGWIGISSALRDCIVERVAETYLNAFEHSASPVGVFTCGQYYPQLRMLHLALVDFGVGIPHNVRRFLGQASAETLNGGKCMEWAFRAGTSTKSAEGISRGLGLDLLKSFIAANHGEMTIMSHDGYVSIVDTGVTYDSLGHFFDGTLINISLRCDDKYYSLASENVPDVEF